MLVEFSGHELMQRTKNFRWNVTTLENEESFLNCIILRDLVIKFSESRYMEGLSAAERVTKILEKLCSMIRKTKQEASLCYDIASNISEVCVFIILCSFLNTSKRIRGKTLQDFVVEHSPLRFSEVTSFNYRTPSLERSEIDRLRQYRNRLLSQGKIYIKDCQWNAISKDAEYEWRFYYDLAKESYDVQDVFKRQKNLYSDIRNTMKFVDQDGFEEKITEAYKKFRSKLKKLECSKYVELQKAIKTRILDDLGYYGINLYRFERRMRPYTITHEVKRLEKCNSDEEEIQALLKMVWLDDVCFPSIYERLFDLPLQITQMYTEVFSEYLERTVILGCLILDELVEQGTFGDAWEKLFIDVSNKMAETVLYDPEKINFEVTEKSQQKFMRILHASVLVEVCAACHRELELEDLLIE